MSCVSFKGAKSRMLNAEHPIQLWHGAFDHSHFTLGPQLHSRNCSCHVRCQCDSWLKLAAPIKERGKPEKATNGSLSVHLSSGSFTFSKWITKVCDTILWAPATQIPWNLSTSQCVYMFFCSDSQAVSYQSPGGCNLFIQILKHPPQTPHSCSFVWQCWQTSAWRALSNLLIAPVARCLRVSAAWTGSTHGVIPNTGDVNTRKSVHTHPPPLPRRRVPRSLLYLWVLTDQRRAAVTLLKSLFLRWCFRSLLQRRINAQQSLRPTTSSAPLHSLLPASLLHRHFTWTHFFSLIIRCLLIFCSISPSLSYYQFLPSLRTFA